MDYPPHNCRIVQDFFNEVSLLMSQHMSHFVLHCQIPSAMWLYELPAKISHCIQTSVFLQIPWLEDNHTMTHGMIIMKPLTFNSSHMASFCRGGKSGYCYSWSHEWLILPDRLSDAKTDKHQ